MGRPKAFDPQIAVMKAMNVFWEKGYDATSMDDLLKAMEISRSSFYSNWADKEEIYLTTMQAFHEMSDIGFKTFTLRSDEGASLPEIIRQFAMAMRMQIMDEGKGSCYIASCALEMAGINSEVMNSSNKFFEMYKENFKFAIKNGIEKGEISEDKDPESTAWFLVNSISGLSVLNKSGTAQDQIENVILNTLSIFKKFSRDEYEAAKKDVDQKYAPLMKNILADMGLKIN